MQDLNGKALAPVKHERGEAREAREGLYISFQISTAGQMLVTLPGHEQMVVPFEIPQDLDVFVTASTVYGHGKIRISSVPSKRAQIRKIQLIQIQVEPEGAGLFSC